MQPMSSQNLIHIDYGHLILLAENLAQHLQRSEATISTKIVGHARLFSRLRQGAGCNAHTYRDALQWLHDNWPADLEWPASIPFPAPRGSSDDDA